MAGLTGISISKSMLQRRAKVLVMLILSDVEIPTSSVSLLGKEAKKEKWNKEREREKKREWGDVYVNNHYSIV